MISIIIVNYNTRQLLRECLASVNRHCPEAQVIVVDNASHDGSAAMVREEFPAVCLIEAERNLGFASANNLGLQQATGDYVVLLNSDTVLQDDALQRCVAFLQANPHIGATSPALRGTDGQPQQCLYPMPSLAALIREAIWLPPLPTETGWLAGTCLIVRATALAEVGGQLDGTSFLYWEDADLSARLLRNGWRVEPFPGACILHHGGASGGGADALRRPDLHAWFVYGKHRFFARYRPWWEAVGVWLLDAADVARKFIRGAVRPARRVAEWSHARVMAVTLSRLLVGLRPPMP
jgi:N-acetylglucosaminyl-diphospho-decaprenol L-rhamnosyltransferase